MVAHGRQRPFQRTNQSVRMLYDIAERFYRAGQDARKRHAGLRCRGPHGQTTWLLFETDTILRSLTGLIDQAVLLCFGRLSQAVTLRNRVRRGSS